MERPASDTIFRELDWLVNYGLGEQHRLNNTVMDEAARRAGFTALCRDLDTSCFYMDAAVTLTGDKVFHLPVMQAQEADGPVVTPVVDIQYETAPDQESGTSFGFSIKELPIRFNDVEDDFPTDFGTRFVVCHVIRTGEERIELGADGDEHITRSLAHFPIESSQLRLQGDFYSHDLRPLRVLDDELYDDVDAILYGRGKLPTRLRAMQALLDEHHFSDMDYDRQQLMVNYLNGCESFDGGHIFWAQYAVDIENDQPLFTRYYPLSAELGHFTLSNRFRIFEEHGSLVAENVGTVIGIQGRLLEPSWRTTIVIPLGQRLGFIEADN